MRLRIQKSATASADLVRVASRVAKEAGKNTGIRFLEAVERAFSEMVEMPGMGWKWKTCNTRLKKMHAWPVPGFNDYLIFYRAYQRDLMIFRIQQGSRDVIEKAGVSREAASVAATRKSCQRALEQAGEK
jgi:hypothetical protein